MRKESDRWTLRPGKLTCACGTPASYITNARSKRLAVMKHATPEGESCPHYEHQAALERTNRALASAGLETEHIPNAPIRFD